MSSVTSAALDLDACPYQLLFLHVTTSLEALIMSWHVIDRRNVELSLYFIYCQRFTQKLLRFRTVSSRMVSLPYSIQRRETACDLGAMFEGTLSIWQLVRRFYLDWFCIILVKLCWNCDFLFWSEITRRYKA